MATIDPTMKNPLPFVNSIICDGCGECIEVCVFGVITIANGKAVVIRPERCESEGACVEVCHTFALSLG